MAGFLDEVGPIVALIIAVVAFFVYIYFGWWRPIKKLNDPSTQNRTPWIMWLTFLGVLPPVILASLITGISRGWIFQPKYYPTGAMAAGGTNVGPTVNVPPGPQPVLSNANRAALRAFAPRNPQPY